MDTYIQKKKNDTLTLHERESKILRTRAFKY